MRETYWDEIEAMVLGKPLLVVGGYYAPEERWHHSTWHGENGFSMRIEFSFFHSAELRSQKHRFYRHLSIDERRRCWRTLVA